MALGSTVVGAEGSSRIADQGDVIPGARAIGRSPRSSRPDRHRVEVDGTGAAGDLERLALAFAELVVSTVGEFDVHELLQVLASRCVDVLDVAASGLMLADADAGLQVMVASNEQAKLLELFQIQHDEGPCLESFRSGEAIVAQSPDGVSTGGRVSRRSPRAWATPVSSRCRCGWLGP